MSKKTIAIIVVGIGLLIIGGAAYYFWGTYQANIKAQATVMPVIESPHSVSAEAFVVPLQESNLAFQTNGQIASVEVAEGDPVTQGQVLAKLDDTSQQISLAEAQANLHNYQASLNKSQASLAQAKASLATLKAGATEEKIIQSQAELEKGEAVLIALINQPTPADVAKAQASVETSRANLAQILAGSRDEDIKSAAANALKAESQVHLAQADYDKYVYGEPQVAETYGVTLQQATLAYDAAKAEYDKTKTGATPEEIAVYRAQLYEAEVALQAVNAGATPEEIVQAQADVKRLQAALADTKAGATPEEIAESEAKIGVAQADTLIARANLESAEANLNSAQADLAKTELTSPFKGMVGSITINPGEYTQTGSTSMVLGDTSRWQIQTDDLTELSRVKIKNGAIVTLRIDALPGEIFTGKVVRITPKSETKSGDVTYTVLIDITGGDTSALSWGMTAYVDIEIGLKL